MSQIPTSFWIKLWITQQKSFHNLGRSFLFLPSPLFYLFNWSYAWFLLYREIRCRDWMVFPLFTLYLPSLLYPPCCCPSHPRTSHKPILEWGQGVDLKYWFRRKIWSLPWIHNGLGQGSEEREETVTIRMKGQFLHPNPAKVAIHELGVHTYTYSLFHL